MQVVGLEQVEHADRHLVVLAGREGRAQPKNTLRIALARLRREGTLRSGSTAVVIGAISSGDQIIDAVQMRKIE